MGNITKIAILLTLLAAAGCTRSSNALNVNTQAPPQPLPSSPSGSIESGNLDPLSQESTAQPNEIAEAPTVGGTAETQETLETASLEPSSTGNSKPITHEQLAGAWNVGSDGSECRVFLSFTQWSGGYRAGSRNCQSAELASVSAWDVKGSRVVLVDSEGKQIASLASAGTERYSGTTVSGNPVSFSR